MNPVMNFLLHLDRRWIFLAMAVAVMTPIMYRAEFPEKATPLVEAVFNKIEELPEGSKILMAFDYDPGSEAELQPMATAWTWHAAKKGHKLYFMCLWPAAPKPARSHPQPQPLPSCLVAWQAPMARQALLRRLVAATPTTRARRLGRTTISARSFSPGNSRRSLVPGLLGWRTLRWDARSVGTCVAGVPSAELGP